jgi:tRNA(adenine34) deaminase
VYEAWLGEALAIAAEAAGSQDVPVGAVVVNPDGVVIGRGRNVREEQADPTGHAEVVALREAALARGGWRLDDCTLVVTLEPCVMCAGAAMAARLKRLVFGAWDPKAGACGSVWDLTRDPLATHNVDVVGGVREAESAALLVDFFEGRRLG